MKVYEIISLNEANPLQWLGRGAEYLGKGIEAVKNPIKAFKGAEGLLKTKVADEIAQIATTKGISIDKAAELYSANLERQIQREVLNLQRDYKEAGQVVPKNVRDIAMKHLNIEPKQLDAAFVKNAATEAQLSKGMTAIGLKDVSVWRGLNKTASSLLNLYGLYEGFYQPWSDFSNEMAKHAQELANGSITEAQYDGYMNQEVTILVSAWATQWVVGGIFKKILLNKEGNTRGFGNFIQKATGADITSAAGVAWFRSQMNDSEFQNWLSSMLLMDIGGKSQPIAQAIGSVLSPIISIPHRMTGGLIGPAATGAEAKGTTKADGTAGSGKPAVGTGAGGNADIAATSPTADGNSTTPASNTATGTLGKSYFNYDSDMTNWEVDPANPQYIRNPKDHSDFVIKPPGWKPAAK